MVTKDYLYNLQHEMDKQFEHTSFKVDGTRTTIDIVTDILHHIDTS